MKTPEQRYFDRACEFIEIAREAQSITELSSAFSKIVTDFGFEYFTVASLCDMANPPDNAVLVMNYPEDWRDHYMEERYERFDRILELSLNNSLPFHWSDPRVERHATDSQKRIFNEAGEAGLVKGITYPVHAFGYLPACINIVGPDKDIPPEAEHALHLMCIYFYEASIRIKEAEKSTKTRTVTHLTPRERECLQWAAEGKSDRDIASILGISARTAHHHIEVSKHKYGVVTRAQAIVKAYAEKQIIVSG